MRRGRFPPQLVSFSVWAAVLSWLAFRVLSGHRPANWRVLALAAVIVALGELLEVDLPGGRSTPVSSAVVFALFVVLPSAADVVLAIVPAFLVGMVVKGREVGFGPRFRSTSRRLAATVVALAAYQPLAAVIPALPVEPLRRGALLSRTAAMVIAGALELMIDTGVSAAFVSRAQRIPGWPVWRGQMRNRLALHGSFLSVAALMALAHAILREAAFVLFLLPLLAARYSFRRYASIHKTYVQTVRALSKVPELAGYTHRGHSVRVAELATAIARDRGLSDNDVQDVEFAALLHNAGVISFDDPADVPESVAGTREGYRLALASARVIENTPYLERVARIMRSQDDPFTGMQYPDAEPAPAGARIVKVASDYVELTEEGGPALSPAAAIEQIDAGVGTEYDPGVVTSLRRVLAHRESP